MTAACAVKTTCPYCGVGCGVLATLEEGGAVTIKGDPDHPANQGRLCSKGSALGETIDLDGRLLYPEIAGERAAWDEALDLVASRFSQAIVEHGPDSVAFYVSGQLLTEDYYVANKLMKGFIGSANIDTNSRLCMASSVAGHRRAFGSDTVPGTYEDLELADLVVLTGSNLAWCHPVLYQRIAAAKAARPEMKIVLIDPRRTMTADIADLHLAIAPDGDVSLFLGLLAHIADNGYIDAAYVGAFTTGLEDAVAKARAQGLAELVSQTGLLAAELEAFFALWAASEKVVTVYSQGVNQSSSGTDKVNAIINCHLATGRIGKPGMGPFSVTGQPNAMGGREVGGLATMLAAHMDIDNPGHRDLVQRFWKSPVIASKPGLKAVDMFQAVGDGRIKAIWIMATNPVDSMPDADAVEAALKACPFVVVSDIMAETDTIRHAHVKLPSLGWGEKQGTVTNSERRISRQRAFLPPPGEARADWWQMAQVASRMGHAGAFDFEGPAAILREYAAQTAFENEGTRDLDLGGLAGLDDKAYAGLTPVQWPRPAHDTSMARGTRFFANGGFFTEDRLARFVPVAPPARVEADANRRFTLNTGRIRDHWHTMTRTGKSPRLSAHVAEPYAEIHPDDATALGIAPADLARVGNEGCEIVVRAMITDRQQLGSIFVPMHWTDQWASSARVDRLVAPVVDPVSGQPALKTSHVGLTRFEASHYGFVVSADRPALDTAAYWAMARADGGWRAEFALSEPLEDAGAFICAMLSIDAATPLLSFSDPSSGVVRYAAFDGGHLLGAVFLSSAPVHLSRSWAADQLQQDFASLPSRWRIIAGRPANDMPDKGAIVCACMNVGVNDIIGAVRAGSCSVGAIGKATGAGTNCGSCKSEIKVILDDNQILAAE
ncbi:MAG: molybdopterin-dependent oxidoreductase [Hoeflea sp.]|uniref:nitrate reductase n=1 Tax=Hoeflea sp. TaxID=1940281 RepID=UPI001D87DCE2|nr:nitrate reductase [Hoeflea sp.]MBU4531582.1 molybdopterin-dependent oxidoreductase [Alphaproteobacteria bacterium]MBU4544439.1 molybdopterin-dependent oxidoreductase [Alphaproteobacteria bacterium]MBU4550324.1 molybdopterin-dependent oxidoreductase [Alphaproteobacteria bacterium]MBV1724858.1 molybdopterin-dependent oxidoreductase [Hoeflea sp.]MBV1760878.1 molybdopterin-dependent oxidoreductase [Hoeflea sp.]